MDWTGLVGRSHECDHPPGVEALPICCRPRIDINAAGHEIDRQVKQRLAEAISIFEIDHRQLSELQPDLILTQDQCEVCAVSLADVEAALGRSTGLATRVLSLAPANLADAWQTIALVGEAMERSDRAAEVIAELESRLQTLAESANSQPAQIVPGWPVSSGSSR
ncbi:MAG: hypothetical protein CM1200mP2_08570 [Planctomycetaceae bacterium]|nr:MAG: hypothetical protein CM1200mP2_08570 [Planctomycetaceae bacterium]